MRPKKQQRNILKARVTERLAAIVLMFKGYRIISFNQHFSGVEVDVLAQKQNCLIIVEVKYRKDPNLMLEAISRAQNERLQKASRFLDGKYSMSTRVDLMLFTSDKPFMQHFKGI